MRRLPHLVQLCARCRDPHRARSADCLSELYSCGLRLCVLVLSFPLARVGGHVTTYTPADDGDWVEERTFVGWLIGAHRCSLCCVLARSALRASWSRRSKLSSPVSNIRLPALGVSVHSITVVSSAHVAF